MTAPPAELELVVAVPVPPMPPAPPLALVAEIVVGADEVDWDVVVAPEPLSSPLQLEDPSAAPIGMVAASASRASKRIEASPFAADAATSGAVFLKCLELPRELTRAERFLLPDQQLGCDGRLH